MIDELKFFAWLDGELGSEEAAEIERQVAADPELQRKAAAHRALGARFRTAFDQIAEAAVPEQLLVTARPSRAEIIAFGTARERRWLRPLPAGIQWAAMAATLVLGIVTGSMISGGGTGPITDANGRLVAASSLERALDARLASAPADSGPRIGLTFRDASGAICRSFTDNGGSGLACREGGDWRIRGLFQAPERQTGEFRMAAGPDPRLAELIDASIAGEPFNATAERQTRDRGWR